MGLIEIKKNFSRRELMWFGPLFAAFVGLLGWLVINRFQAQRFVYVMWAVSAVLIVLYYLIPALRLPFYRGWLYAVMPIGWVISHVLLMGIYYLLLTPIGLVMRLCGYDPMQRKPDPSATTYWIAREQQPDSQSYFKQY